MNTTFAQDVQADIQPLLWDDSAQGGALETFINGIGAMFQPLRNLGRADALGNPGWSQLLDITRCPTVNLPYLGQYVGVRVNQALTDAQQRAQIQAESGMARGSVGAVTAAARNLLTGSQTVIVLERTPDPYSFAVITYTSETPNPAAVLAALIAAKPAGLVMTYTSVTGQLWEQLVTSYATWAAVVAAFPNWQDVINDTP